MEVLIRKVVLFMEVLIREAVLFVEVLIGRFHKESEYKEAFTSGKDPLSRVLERMNFQAKTRTLQDGRVLRYIASNVLSISYGIKGHKI